MHACLCLLMCLSVYTYEPLCVGVGGSGGPDEECSESLP